ncbi:hypothetical protein [Methanolapillus ohkumae]|uniref:Ribbon-helix-helix protein, CopG family n=1 Tax=Methanolapillus ohkumae TaxID=3028298 RepID=A0AA96ZW90_9EURY|nr:hypothetical protein MsAm2_00760 [Methanosarcinaceae archaeon Am2]
MTKEYIRKKPVISGTISPTHKRKIDELIKDGEFASVSDFLNQAVSDYLKNLERPQGNFSLNTNRGMIEEIVREQITLYYAEMKEKELKENEMKERQNKMKSIRFK